MLLSNFSLPCFIVFLYISVSTLDYKFVKAGNMLFSTFSLLCFKYYFRQRIHKYVDTFFVGLNLIELIPFSFRIGIVFSGL